MEGVRPPRGSEKPEGSGHVPDPLAVWPFQGPPLGVS